MTQKLRLSPHVFICRTSDHFVLLDLKRDRYFSLDLALAQRLLHQVEGVPVIDSSISSYDPGDASRALKLMQRAGLLVRKYCDAQIAARADVRRPTAELVADEIDSHAAISCYSALNLLAARIKATLALRYRSIEQVVAGIEHRKKLAAQRAPEFDLRIARNLTHAFGALQPWLFSSREKCLQNSLTLLYMWPRTALYPTWVFGVKTQPFAAHCWLQYEDVVLNDTLDHVSHYTAIMAV